MQTGMKVAVKKFTRPFQSPIHAKRTHRELRLLRSMNHDNIIDIMDIFTPDLDAQSLQDVLVFRSYCMGQFLNAFLIFFYCYF